VRPQKSLGTLYSAFIGGYTLFDAGASYTRAVGGHDMVFRINEQNITRKRYWASTGALVLSEGPPGDIRFSMSWRY
jgi:iron complex outermembrane recepter protein